MDNFRYRGASLPMKYCSCGSGKPQKLCHKNMNPQLIRGLLRYEFSTHDGFYAGFTQNFVVSDFET
jgi:hypothetical protein